MKNVFIQIAVLVSLILPIQQIYAMESTCEIGDPDVGYNTVYHRAHWDYLDYAAVHAQVDPVFYYLTATITTPPMEPADTYATPTYGEDTKKQVYPNPLDGYYEFEADSYLGYPDLDAIFRYIKHANCDGDGYVKNTPIVTVTLSPSTQVVSGTPVTITWTSTPELAQSCSYNGGIPLPSTSGTSAPFAANEGNAKTYTVSCVGPLGRTGVASATLSLIQPTIGISGVPAPIELLQNYTLTSSVQPSGTPVTDYKFEIKYQSGADQTWYSLGNGTSASLTTYAKNPGNFDMRATATIYGTQYSSISSSTSFLFPSSITLRNTATVQQAALARFNSVKAYATAHQDYKREEGFWIFLNNASKQYQFSIPTIEGLAYPHNFTPSIDLGNRPADSNTSPTPVSSVIYTVGSFHAHTPATYDPSPSTNCRGTGPSTADQTLDTNQNVTGLVGDYLATLVCPGHAIDFAAPYLYQSGPIRRDFNQP